MTAEQVLWFQNAAPFKAFELLLADGRAIAIEHPDFATVSKEEQLIHVYELPDGEEVVDLMLVVSLRSPVKSGAAGRGR